MKGHAPRGALLTGLRGVGKTVLLNELHDRAVNEGFICDLLEAPEGLPLAPLLIPSGRKALLRLSVTAQARDLIERGLRVLKSFQLSAKLGDAEFGIKYEPEIGIADSGNLERDLPELLVAIGEAAKAQNQGVAILIDEIQYLSGPDLSALIVASHRVVQRQLPVIISGAGLPSLPGLLGDAKSYAERLFRYPIIGPLAYDDAVAALAEPADSLGVSYSKSALERIYYITQGYPYFVQEWGSVLWDLSTGPEISEDDVINCHKEATRRLDESFFRVRLNRVTDAEQRYMRAMAELGPGPYRSGDVAKILGKSTNSFGPVRDGLIRKGMIYSPKHGVLEFTVPLFEQFMKRSVPHLKETI